jgi:hypothetical protein
MPEPESPQTETSCPVPPEQRPLQEYSQLCRSWFFRWPTASSFALAKPLLISWALALPICLLVSSGSHQLRHEPLRFVLVAAVMAVLPPLLMLWRQWLGWGYVLGRLRAERIFYEESGWYDGQEWIKPISWRQQDLLVATHQVAPIHRRLSRGLMLALALLLGGAGVCQAL